ncbi:MAG: hypothetical protein MHM6MM_003707 [Cercozoa sp. M6MM]
MASLPRFQRSHSICSEEAGIAITQQAANNVTVTTAPANEFASRLDRRLARLQQNEQGPQPMLMSPLISTAPAPFRRSASSANDMSPLDLSPWSQSPTRRRGSHVAHNNTPLLAPAQPQNTPLQVPLQLHASMSMSPSPLPMSGPPNTPSFTAQAGMRRQTSAATPPATPLFGAGMDTPQLAPRQRFATLTPQQQQMQMHMLQTRSRSGSLASDVSEFSLPPAHGFQRSGESSPIAGFRTRGRSGRTSELQLDPALEAQLQAAYARSKQSPVLPSASAARRGSRADQLKRQHQQLPGRNSSTAGSGGSGANNQQQRRQVNTNSDSANLSAGAAPPNTPLMRASGH